MRRTVQEYQVGTASSSEPRPLLPLTVLPEALLSSPPMLASDNELPNVQHPPNLSPDLAKQVRRWDFNIHSLPADELPAFCFSVLLSHDEFAQLPLSRTRLWKYIEAVASKYHSNAFHSFRHAVDVALASSCLVRALQLKKPDLLSPLQVAAQLIAAVVHDTDHPGVMNGFLVATRHPLAILYNDRSVLENHHISTAIALLSRPEHNFLHNMEKSDQDEFRRLLIDLVLATDVTTTMPFVKQLEASLEAGEELVAARAQQIIIKAADISNPSRSLAIYQKWIDGVMSEFFAQGDAERGLGLPISMNCDRNTVLTSKCQVGFITFLVEPVFNCISKCIPEVQHICMANLHANKTHFTNAQE
mmetsp:Transcript_40045/g.66443  ORF Transcript_40045/g.66443 Transcript_40045/m.66443 type:complete len:360 (+) Transcript_40045:368-1447(+)